MNQQYVLKTLGCKANLYDSQLIEAELKKQGWAPFSGSPQQLLCIVNSCTVTDEADRQSRKLAARMHREHPQATVVITGCAAEVDPERLANSKGIHYVIGNSDKPGLVRMILGKISENPRPEKGEILGVAKNYQEMLSRHPMDREWPDVGEITFTDFATTRAFLKIQEGCNSFCTYCIIPYGRGPSRSLRPREIIEQVRKLAANGTREIVITGTNIGDYGMDWSDQPMLTELVQSLLKDTDVERIRVSSLDPTEIPESMIRLMESDSRFCPHFHVSLQSASDRILRLMKRKYGTKEVRETLTRISQIASPAGGVFVGMDVITGFPGETEEHFDETYQLLSDLPWSRLHVFPYSEREGTPATRLPVKVQQSVRNARARLLSELSLTRLKSKYESVLKSEKTLDGVLLERVNRGPFKREEGWLAGYTPNYLRVFVPKENGERNKILSIQPTSIFVDAPSGDIAFIAK